MSDFPCTKCGVCCRILPRLKPGWPCREDGACQHLNADNTCAIYEKRPEECRFGAMHAKLFAGMPEREYHQGLADTCNAMQAEVGTPKELRVVIP